MKSKISEYLKNILSLENIEVFSPKEKQFGDFSTNIAMVFSKNLKKSPKETARELVKKIEEFDKGKIFSKIEIAGAGYINFFVNQSFLIEQFLEIFKKGQNFGSSDFGKAKKVLLEFVSANPTGPLHIGHGRWAAIGDSLARILSFAGYDVTTEFYVNDVGRQVNLLIESVECVIKNQQIPEDGYKGFYINEIAKKIKEEKPSDLKNFILESVISSQKQTLKNLNVVFDNWFFESELHKSKALDKVLDKLKAKNLTFEKNGALWFKSEMFGDDKDRVLVRENGEPTYFLSDIAYHLNKFERSYDILINVWGTDHHGYVKRLQAALDALGLASQNLEIIIGQLVSLYRGKEQIRMSKRTGDMITLQEVIEEIGADATRFFLVMTGADTHIDFDLELAKKKSLDNPVYYVQYAFVRISNIIKNSGLENIDLENVDISILDKEEEKEIMLKILEFPEVVKICANQMQPHHLVRYARDFSAILHSYYHKYRVIGKDEKTTKARVILMHASRIALQNVLKLLGISTPERM